MSSDALPEDPAQQWDVLLCIIAFEERKKDNRPTGATETLNYIFHHEGIQKIFTEWLLQMKRFYDKQWAEDTSRKSDELSALWRERGNVKFKLQLYDEAYSLYNKSVLYAKKDSPLYSIAMANRSAVSLRLKRFEDCLLDVQRALRHEYPPELQHKLILRRAECYYQMGLGEPCVDAMNEALKYNNRVQLRGISKIDFDNTFHAMENKLDLLNFDPVPQSVERLPKLFQGENPKFRSASNAVELVRNDEVGRHVLVKKPVKRGDVIFSEEPFASVKLPTNQLPHPYYCDHCCSGDQAVIGCCKCSRAIYCDDGCYAINKKMYHRWECAGLRYNIFQNIGIAHLAFRVLLKYAYLSFPPLPEDVKEPTTADALLEAYANVDSVGVYGTEYSAFYSMFQLATNLDIPANVDFMQYAVTSTMLTIYLEQHTKFFKYFAKKVRYPLPFHELKLLCAGLIFRTLGQLVTNANTVMELNAGPVREIPNCFLANCIRNPWRKVGSAVYPSASMMNHSCEPNITSLFYKNHLYVKAITELPVGEEVLNCYGPHYARHNTEVRRQRLLNQYGFECKCRACVDSTRNNFVSMFSAYVCTSCKGPVMWEGARMSCHQCTTEFPQQKAQNAAETAEAMQAIAMQAKTKEEKCRLMLRAYKLMQQVLYRHHNVLRKAIDDLAMLYNAIEEYSKSYDLVKQNIQSFEYQYGSFSVEVTNELRKLSNLMLGRIMRFLNNPEADAAQPIPIKEWIVETLYITKKANQLMELNFGTWQPMYKVVKDNEEVLESMVAEPCDEEDIGCFNMLLQNLNFT